MRWIFWIFVLCFLSVPANAGFFLERDAAEEEAKMLDADAGVSFGGGFSAAYYLGAFDFALEGVAAYRFGNGFGLGTGVSLGISEFVHEADLEVFKYVGSDDFFGIGSGAVLLKREGDVCVAPRIFADYGRNMKPWPRAHFALQAKIRISYLVGESLERKETYRTKLAGTVFSGQVAFVFF